MNARPSGSRGRLGATLRSPALVQHVLGVAVVMVMIGLAVTWLSSDRATAEAERSAAANVRTVALGIASPLATRDIIGDPAWRQSLERTATGLIDSGEIATLHIWRRVNQDMGEILWSTSGERIGAVVPLGGAKEALETGESVLEKLHNGTESEGPALPNLYEIYLPFTDQTGADYVLEIYKPVREYDEIRSRLLRDWLPISLIGVLVMGAVTLPLSLRLARAVGVAERDRALFADRALRARSEEHRRMSETIHERTIQDLAAARLMLESVRDHPAPKKVSRVIERTAEILAFDIQDLRDLLTTGEAADWYVDDLADALDDWLELLPQSARIIRDLGEDPLPLSRLEVALAFRLVKEAVRNAVKHADATRIVVRVRREGDWLGVAVSDDGHGFDQEVTGGLGLRIIRYAVADAGGRLSIASTSGTGTTVRIQLPSTV